MDKKASEMMNDEVEVGVQLEAQDLVKKAVGGGIAGRIVAGAEVKEASLPGDHKGILYMAVGKNKVGFFSVKQGFFKNSLKEMLAEHPRNAIKALEIEKGMMSTAHIVLEDGTHYALMCAKMNVKKLKKAQELLGFS